MAESEGTRMDTLLAPDLALLDFEPALPCAFPVAQCQSHHAEPATLRLLVEHMVDAEDGEHDRGIVIACEPCYEWLVKNPQRIVACPTHGPISRLRDWWQLLGVV